MTLIEVMIVLVIVAGILVGGATLFGGLSRANLKGQALRLSGYLKFAYGQSAIQQQFYRLVIDLDSDEYWVEEVPEEEVGGAPPPAEPTSTFGGPGLAPRPQTQGYAPDDAEGGAFGLKRPKFQEVDEKLARRRKLSGGVHFDSVIKSYDEGAISTGQAFIGFYPSGFVDRSQILLKDDDGACMALQLQPLTGKVQLVNGCQEADQDFFEVEEEE